MVELLRQAVPVSALVVAVDPGKVSSRVWVTSGERGLIGEPVSLPMLREGIDTLAGLIGASEVAGPPIIGVEATGGLHRAWVAEVFGPMVSDDEALLDLLVVATDVYTWKLLRRDRGLSRVRTEARMKALVTAVLATTDQEGT